MPALLIQKPVTMAAVNLDASATAEQISATTLLVRSIIFTGHPNNAGNIWIGDSDVAVGRGVPLAAGESVTYEFDSIDQHREAHFDLSDFYFDGDTTGDDCCVEYILDREVHL